jgi:polysaccharide deacetylase 2 family uncharacterized protein YibQ
MPSLPPQHKKRLYQGIIAYLLLLICAGTYIFMHSGEILKLWNETVPHARAQILAAAAPEEAFHKTPQATDPAAAEVQGPVKAAAASDDSLELAIIITNGGISDAMTQTAIDTFPPAVAIAFSPYSPRVREWIDHANKSRHESLILLPMEPSAYPKDDPGAKALLTRLGEKENEEFLAWSIERSPSIIGMMNFMGDRFLSDEERLIPVFAKLRAKNLLFVENPEFAGTSGAAAAEATSVSYIAADMHIGAAETEMSIRQKFVDLERKLFAKGHAVIVVSPYPTTLHILSEWVGSLDNRGIRLVPLSEIMKISRRGQNIEKQDASSALGDPETP